MALSDLLAGDKFIQGYDSSRQRGMQEQGQQIGQMGGLMNILQNAQGMQDRQRALQEEQFLKQTLAQSKSPEEAIQKLISMGTPQAIKLAGVLAEASKDMRPKTAEPFTLGPGQVRYGPDGKVLAQTNKVPESKTRTFQAGEDSITQELQPDGTWKEIGRGPKFAKSVGTTIHNPAPVTSAVGKDPESPTGWSHFDARTGRRTIMGAPPPGQSQEAVQFSGAKMTAREMAERDLAYPEATKQIEIAKENITALKEQLKALKMHKGLPGITGAVYGRTGSVAKESMAAQSIYNNITSNLFVTALQSMRNASKTGGAVGNVSDREGDKLERTLAALDRAQSTPDFQKQVGIALDRLATAQKNIEDAYKSTYEYKNKWEVVK
jgi:hypothetical protein